MIQFSDLTEELQHLVQNNSVAGHSFRLARHEKWKLRRFLEFVAVQMAKQSIAVSEAHQELYIYGPPPQIVICDEQNIARLKLEYCGPEFGPKKRQRP